MKHTIDYSTLEISIQKQRVYYRTFENYNVKYCILFEDLKKISKVTEKSKEYYLVIKEILNKNYPEELL